MATEKTSFENSLLQLFIVDAGMATPITVQVSGLVVSGTFTAPSQDSSDRGKIQIDNAKVLTPNGKVLKFVVWECRLDAIIGFALESARLEDN